MIVSIVLFLLMVFVFSFLGYYLLILFMLVIDEWLDTCFYDTYTKWRDEKLERLADKVREYVPERFK